MPEDYRGRSILDMLRAHTFANAEQSELQIVQTLIEIPLKPFSIDEVRKYIAKKCRVPTKSVSNTFVYDVYNQCGGKMDCLFYKLHI